MAKAHSLCSTTEEGAALDLEVAFLKGLRALLIKGDPDEGDGTAPRNVDVELQQLLSGALVSEGVTDIFQVAGLQKPDISILSDQFLTGISKIPQKNLAVDLLQRLLQEADRHGQAVPG
jgi:type I restriction enzyme R subunit